MPVRLRKDYGISPARFDLLAQLERAPEGLKLNELSRPMRVTSGNVTGLPAYCRLTDADLSAVG